MSRLITLQDWAKEEFGDLALMNPLMIFIKIIKLR